MTRGGPARRPAQHAQSTSLIDLRRLKTRRTASSRRRTPLCPRASQTLGLDIPQYLHVADYMIAFNMKSADVERVGSHMQLIKTKFRTSLHDQTFMALVFLSFNLPFLHEIDIGTLVAAWKAAGHRMPIRKNDADSIVLTRLHAEATPTFFLKKGSPYLPTDFGFLVERAFATIESDNESESDSVDLTTTYNLIFLLSTHEARRPTV
jgi:hypothetical protein